MADLATLISENFPLNAPIYLWVLKNSSAIHYQIIPPACYARRLNRGKVLPRPKGNGVQAPGLEFALAAIERSHSLKTICRGTPN